MLRDPRQTDRPDGTVRPGGRRRRLAAGALLFLVALGLRVTAVVELAALPTAGALVMDAERYDRLAAGILDRGWVPDRAFDQAPGYPYFLAAVYTAAGRSPLAVRLLQAALDAVSVVLLAAVAARLFGGAAGLVTGVLAALYGPLVFHTALLLKPTLVVLLTAVFLALWLAALGAGRGGAPTRGIAGDVPTDPAADPPVEAATTAGESSAASSERSSVSSSALHGRGPSGGGLGAAASAPGSLLRSALLALGAGLALGLSAQLRENALALVPFAVAAAWLWPPAPRAPGPMDSARRRLAVGAALVAGVALALVPTVAANRRASGEWLATSSQGGMNFLIGNARGATGSYSPLDRGSQDPDEERADARRLAARILEARRPPGDGAPVDPAALSPATVSRTLWSEGWREIAAAPGGWLHLVARKVRLFWNRYEIPDAEGYDLYRRRSPTLRLAAVDLGWVAPLALAGLVLGLGGRGREGRASVGGRRVEPDPADGPRGQPHPALQRQTTSGPRDRALAAIDIAGRRSAVLTLALLAAGVCLSVIAFFVFARYRLPVVVFLLPLAGYGAVALADRVRRRRWRAVAAGLVAVAAGLLAVVPPAFGRDELARQEAILRFNLATAGLRSAEPLVDRALAGAQAGPRSGGESEASTGAEKGAAPAAPRGDDLAQAAELLSGAIRELDGALVEHPGFAAARVTRGVARHRLGNLRLLAGDPERALREYLAAREDLRQGARIALAAGDRDLAGRAREVAVAVEGNLARAETAISGG